MIAADTRLGLLLDEYLDRACHGECPDPDEYAARFPDLADTFRRLAAALGTLASARDDAPPAVPGFRVVREVGRGGMGVVFEAVEEALGRRVALKTLPPQAVAHPLALARFRREAKAAAGLHHPHIVPVFGVGEQGGVHYYVMQFVAGETLAQWIARRADPGEPGWRFAARVGMQLADALDYAHAHGVLHRDVKPGNVLLAAGPGGAVVPYLADFGLAKLAGDDLTGTGDFVGTLRYSAPEQFGGVADARSDLYALGLTVYELLTGRPAFDAPDRDTLLRQVTATDPPRPRTIDRAIPRELETVVLMAVAKEPGRRYPTAAALAADLRRVLAGEPVAARRTGPIGRGWRWCRRNPTVAGLATAVGTLLVAVAATAVIGYVHTADALAVAQGDRKAADDARSAQTEAKEEAVRKADEARRSLAMTLSVVRKTNAIVDTLPDEPLGLPLAWKLQSLADKSPPRLPPGAIQRAAFVALYEEFVRDPAPDPAARLEQVRSGRRLGFLLAASNRRADALRAYQSAVAAADGLVASDPGRAEYRTEAVACRGHLGLFKVKDANVWPIPTKDPKANQRATGNAAVAAACRDLALAAINNPADAGPAVVLADLLDRYARHAPTARRPDLLRDAAVWRRVVWAAGGDPADADRLDDLYKERVAVLRAAKKHGEAGAVLDEWAAALPETLARVLAVARTAAEAATEASDAVVATAYADRAVRWFTRWADLGGKDRTQVRQLEGAPAFKDRADFRALVPRLGYSTILPLRSRPVDKP